MVCSPLSRAQVCYMYLMVCSPLSRAQVCYMYLTVCSPLSRAQPVLQVMSLCLPALTHLTRLLPLVGLATPLFVLYRTMSEPDTITMGHHCILILTHDNFSDWEIAIISYLTNTSDHVRVIKQRTNSMGVLADPAQPSDAKEANKWDTSEREALSIIMATVSKLHREVILKHCADKGAVYRLWVKICNSHQSRDASLHHQAWMEFFTTRKAPDESYSAYVMRKEGLGARIERLTPAAQTKAKRYAELTLFTILFRLPYNDHICQALTTQSNLTLQKASNACVHIDTGLKLHLTTAESANAAAGTRNCWKCDLPGHVAASCPHASAIKDIVTKWNAAYREKKPRRSRNQATTSPSTSTANVTTSIPDTSHNETAGVATSFLSSVDPVTDDWLCDSGASCSMTSRQSAFLELREDRRPVRLADGMIIQSEGIGSV